MKARAPSIKDVIVSVSCMLLAVPLAVAFVVVCVTASLLHLCTDMVDEYKRTVTPTPQEGGE